ncbi:MAG: NADH-quinone oxidoreductase subunit I [Desulfurococcales archaeon ex4484_58]|nr:MAG: NADH-quinone oxidoreductase subunit I [Desulfurococcales archaeon ex4484_58]
MGKPKILKLILKNFVSKPATLHYPLKEYRVIKFPYEHTLIEEDARGRHYADLTKCTGCSLCKLDCPADAIEMIPIPEGYEAPKINPRKIYPVVNYFRCVFCYRCVTICPVNAYITTSEYRLASPESIDSSQLSLSTLKKASGG